MHVLADRQIPISRFRRLPQYSKSIRSAWFSTSPPPVETSSVGLDGRVQWLVDGGRTCA